MCSRLPRGCTVPVGMRHGRLGGAWRTRWESPHSGDCVVRRRECTTSLNRAPASVLPRNRTPCRFPHHSVAYEMPFAREEPLVVPLVVPLVIPPVVPPVVPLKRRLKLPLKLRLEVPLRNVWRIPSEQF